MSNTSQKTVACPSLPSLPSPLFFPFGALQVKPFGLPPLHTLPPSPQTRLYGTTVRWGHPRPLLFCPGLLHQNKTKPKGQFIMKSCKYCKSQQYFAKHESTHFEICGMYPMTCPNKCLPKGQTILRRMINVHLSTICPLQVIPCKFGCHISNLLRKDERTLHYTKQCPNYLMLCIYEGYGCFPPYFHGSERRDGGGEGTNKIFRKNMKKHCENYKMKHMELKCAYLERLVQFFCLSRSRSLPFWLLRTRACV